MTRSHEPTRRQSGPHTAASLTVEHYLTGWLAGRQTLRPSTRLAYDVHVRRYLIPHLGYLGLAELTVADIEDMYRAIARPAGGARTVSAATVRRIHATLTCALNHAVRRGLLATNPARHVELPAAPHPQTRTWSADQLTRFLTASEGHRLHPVFLLLAVTGMRRGEALGLRWDDIDLELGTVRIDQQLVLVGRDVITGPPKTHRGRRVIALPRRAVEALRWHAARQRLDRHTAATSWAETGFVFTTTTGQRLHPAQVSRVFQRLTAAANLPPIRLHDLRHTSASLGLAGGESLLEVSRRLGHSTIAITADVYSHIDATTARRSAERLAAMLTPDDTGTATPQ